MDKNVIKRCIKCNAERQDGAKFCAYCGIEFDKEKCCTKCGERIDYQEFCPACGAKSKSRESEQLASEIKEAFLKTFPNLIDVKPEKRSRYWVEAIAAPLASALCGLLLIILLEKIITVDNRNTWMVIKYIGLLFELYVLIRFFGHIYISRWIDINPDKRPIFIIAEFVFLGLSIYGVFELVALMWAYLVCIVAGVYLGSLPSYQKNIGSSGKENV